MPISMDLLRSETLEHLGIDADDLDASGTANLDLLINRSWWDLLAQVEFKEKDKDVTFDTVAAQRDYSIATIIGSDIFDAINNLSILDLNDSQHSDMDMTSVQWYEDNYNEQSSLQAAPEKFLHYGSNLRLYPTPDQVYTITVYYKYILNDLTAGNPAIPQDWHEVIMYGAVKRGLIRARDYNSAQFIDTEFGKSARRRTTQAKEMPSVKDAAVEVRRNPYNVRH